MKILKQWIDDVLWRISLSRVSVGISWRNAWYARKTQKFDTTVATSLKFMNNQ
jgi:hypothetical protein